MFICRLFHRDQPFEQIEARLIGEGKTTAGRDPGADWMLPDPEGVLSRIHLTLAVEAGRLFVCDHSTNGTYLPNGERAPAEQPREIFNRDALRLGPLTLLVDEAVQSENDGATSRTTILTPPANDANEGPMAEQASSAHRDGSLIEAFCEGAGLDASALSSQDPAELMRRIGHIYHQTVLGLSMLMAERARLKGHLDLDRTTISAVENNPFKWTPTRKLAEDLLCGDAAGFLSDAEAVKACFTDLSHHMAAMAEGAEAAASLAMQTLAPDSIDAEAKSQGSLLRSRQAVCWDIFMRRYEALSAGDTAPGALKQAFGETYRHAAPNGRG